MFFSSTLNLLQGLEAFANLSFGAKFGSFVKYKVLVQGA